MTRPSLAITGEISTLSSPINFPARFVACTETGLELRDFCGPAPTFSPAFLITTLPTSFAALECFGAGLEILDLGGTGTVLPATEDFWALLCWEGGLTRRGWGREVEPATVLCVLALLPEVAVVLVTEVLGRRDREAELAAVL